MYCAYKAVRTDLPNISSSYEPIGRYQLGLPKTLSQCQFLARPDEPEKGLTFIEVSRGGVGVETSVPELGSGGCSAGQESKGSDGERDHVAWSIRPVSQTKRGIYNY